MADSPLPPPTLRTGVRVLRAWLRTKNGKFPVWAEFDSSPTGFGRYAGRLVYPGNSTWANEPTATVMYCGATDHWLSAWERETFDANAMKGTT